MSLKSICSEFVRYLCIRSGLKKNIQITCTFLLSFLGSTYIEVCLTNVLCRWRAFGVCIASTPWYATQKHTLDTRSITRFVNVHHTDRFVTSKPEPTTRCDMGWRRGDKAARSTIYTTPCRQSESQLWCFLSHDEPNQHLSHLADEQARCKTIFSSIYS